MSKEDHSSPKHSYPTCSDEIVPNPLPEADTSDKDTGDKDTGEKEQFEWMSEPSNEESCGAEANFSAPETEVDEDLWSDIVDISTIPWQTYCSLPNWGIHRVKVQCDTFSPHSTLHGTFRHTVAGKIALDLGQQTIDLPAMDLEGETVVVIEVEVQGQLLQVAARLTATSGPISLRLGRDTLAGRFVVDPAKRSEGNA